MSKFSRTNKDAITVALLRGECDRCLLDWMTCDCRVFTLNLFDLVNLDYGTYVINHI